MNLYFFGWPSSTGGASTKLAHVICLLARHYDITVVPPKPACLKDKPWLEFLEVRGCRFALWRQLPERLDGWAVAMCYSDFLRKTLAAQAKQRGLRVAWSNDMMWHFPLELGTLFSGAIDAVMYVSPLQRRALEPGYRRALLAEPELDAPKALEGVIKGTAGHRVRWVMTDNYIDTGWFPYRDRFNRGFKRSGLVIGRLSRADPQKFPDDFPATYENLGLKRPRYRVMGWSPALARKFRAHRFGPEWDLLPESAMDAADFLRSLDLYVYSVGPTFRESWGRAVVEAMLTGAVPILHTDIGFATDFIQHGQSGFLCQDHEQFRKYARLLQDEPERRRIMSLGAHEHAVKSWCRPEYHRALWRRLFES